MPKTEAEDRLRLIIAYVTLGAWLSSFVLDAVLPKYDPPAGVQGIAMIVVGYFFAEPFTRGLVARRNGKKEDAGDAGKPD